MNKRELIDAIENGFSKIQDTEIIDCEPILDAISKKLGEYKTVCGQDKFLKENLEKVCQYRKEIKAEQRKRERQ